MKMQKLTARIGPAAKALLMKAAIICSSISQYYVGFQSLRLIALHQFTLLYGVENSSRVLELTLAFLSIGQINGLLRLNFLTDPAN